VGRGQGLFIGKNRSTVEREGAASLVGRKGGRESRVGGRGFSRRRPHWVLVIRGKVSGETLPEKRSLPWGFGPATRI